jgi:hypothetical protein
MAEWKLFTDQVPEQRDYLIVRPWMNLEGQPGFAQRAQMVVDLVRSAGPVASISDLGCGDGSLLARLQAAGIDVPMWGYDFGAGDIAHGQRQGLDVRFGDVVDGSGIEYGELIIASEVAEHVADPEGFLRSLPGRLLIISSPADETGDWHNEIHAWAWDTQGYYALARRSGWIPVRHVTCEGGLNTFAGVTRPQRFQAIFAVRLADSFWQSIPARRFHGLGSA